MPIVSVLFGTLLIVLGLDGYLDLVGVVRPEHPQSPTSLIPAYLGAVLMLCGLLALKASLLKHAMHAAAAVGLLGFLGGLTRGLMGLGAGETGKAGAIREQFWLAGVCLVFVALCVNSFIQARRRRAASTA